MNRNSFALCLAIVTGVVACTNTTGSEARLIGDWVKRENLSPSGYYTTQLSFAEDGTFTDAVRDFGCYPGQSRDDPCAYTIMSGTYTIEGDQLRMNVSRIATWDRGFNGPGSPEVVRNVNSTVFDSSHFRIAGLLLTLDYLSFPADAAVATTATFVRVL
jgi:hypothetical protein